MKKVIIAAIIIILITIAGRTLMRAFMSNPDDLSAGLEINMEDDSTDTEMAESLMEETSIDKYLYLVDDGFIHGKTLVFDAAIESTDKLENLVKRLVDQLEGTALSIKEWIEIVLELDADDAGRRENLHSNDLNMMMKKSGDSVFIMSLADKTGKIIRSVDARKSPDGSVLLSLFDGPDSDNVDIKVCKESVEELLNKATVFVLTGLR